MVFFWCYVLQKSLSIVESVTVYMVTFLAFWCVHDFPVHADIKTGSIYPFFSYRIPATIRHFAMPSELIQVVEVFIVYQSKTPFSKGDSLSGGCRRRIGVFE